MEKNKNNMNTSMNCSLTSGQRAKIRAAYKQGNGVIIQLSKEQLLQNSGKDRISLTQEQYKEITKSRVKGKGCRLVLSNSQLQQNYKGGFLPLIFAGLGALSGLLGGGAAVANSVIDYKDRQKRLEETIRHNKAMENNKTGGLVKHRPKSKNKKIKKKNLKR